jgi:hypothetical protein
MAYKSKTKFPEISNPSNTSYCHVDPAEVKKGLRPECSVHVHRAVKASSASVDFADVVETDSALSAASYLKDVESEERAREEIASSAAKNSWEERVARIAEEENIIQSVSNNKSFDIHLMYGGLPSASAALSVLNKYDFYSESENNKLSVEDEQVVLEALVIAVAVAEKSKREGLGLVEDEYVNEASRVRQLLFAPENIGWDNNPERLPMQDNYDYNGKDLGYKSPADAAINFLYGMKNNSYRNEKVRSNVRELLSSNLERPIEDSRYAEKPKRGFLGLFNRN